LLVILSVAILTLYFREGSNGFLHRVQRYTVNIVVPLQAGISRAVSPIKSAFRFVAEIGSLRAKNQGLEKENKKLKTEIVSLRLMKKENERLRKLVGFKEKTDFTTIPAHVIGKSSTDWQAAIVLDKGSDDGVEKNMPVVVDSGLVGQVIDSSPKACRVQLITDQKSGVGVQMLSTGETGVLQGQINGELKINFISKDSKAKKGDEVVTSGLGGVFPKGLYVGKVKKIARRPYSLFKEIDVESSVEFVKLEEVLIITSPLPKNPYETEED
jgi:rod shape-determining protein MreC